MLGPVDLRSASQVCAQIRPQVLLRDDAEECETGCESRCETLFSLSPTPGLS